MKNLTAIELFGNEVDSIRIFDPESQLSERRLLQVNIIPNIETHFSTEKKISLFEFLPENTVDLDARPAFYPGKNGYSGKRTGRIPFVGSTKRN